MTTAETESQHITDVSDGGGGYSFYGCGRLLYGYSWSWQRRRVVVNRVAVSFPSTPAFGVPVKRFRFRFYFFSRLAIACATVVTTTFSLIVCYHDTRIVRVFIINVTVFKKS